MVLAEDVVLPMTLDLRYDIADPYAVSMTFHLCTDDTVRWVVGRDLLLAGQHRLTGAGDVQVWPSDRSGAGEVHIALAPYSRREAVTVTAPAQGLDTFLRQTLELVPVGTEECHLDMDGTVHRLMSGSGRPRR